MKRPIKHRLNILVLGMGAVLLPGLTQAQSAFSYWWGGSNWIRTASGNPFPVTCVSGCSAAGAFTDNSAFTVGTSAVAPIGAYFTSGAAPSITSGNAGRLRMDASSFLDVNCQVGCSGSGSTTPSDSFANPTNAITSFNLLAGFNGTTWDRLRVDGSKNLNVNISASSATVPANVAQINGNTTSTAASGVQKVGIVGNAGAALDQAPGSAVPANALQVGGSDGTNTRVEYMDPCNFNAWTYFVINTAANVQIVAGSASKNVYICKEYIQPVAAATNVEIVESATSGNACATSPTGMMGGATAATGATLAINGGFVLAADKRAWAKTATVGDAACLFVSAQTNGVVAYVQF